MTSASYASGRHRASTLEFEYTRHLIKKGGLTQNAGHVDLAEDHRAAVYAHFSNWRKALDDGCTLWKRRDKRAFDAEKDTRGAQV